MSKKEESKKIGFDAPIGSIVTVNGNQYRVEECGEMACVPSERLDDKRVIYVKVDDKVEDTKEDEIIYQLERIVDRLDDLREMLSYRL